MLLCCCTYHVVRLLSFCYNYAADYFNTNSCRTVNSGIISQQPGQFRVCLQGPKSISYKSSMYLNKMSRPWTPPHNDKITEGISNYALATRRSLAKILTETVLRSRLLLYLRLHRIKYPVFAGISPPLSMLGASSLARRLVARRVIPVADAPARTALVLTALGSVSASSIWICPVPPPAPLVPVSILPSMMILRRHRFPE